MAKGKVLIDGDILAYRAAFATQDKLLKDAEEKVEILIEKPDEKVEIKNEKGQENITEPEDQPLA